LTLGLLWWADDRKDFTTDLPQQFVAPSWSWAAINRRVLFAASECWYAAPDAEKTFSVLKQYFQVESADCQLATPELTGQVRGGQLTVSGRLFDAVPHGDPRSLTVQASGVVIAANEWYESTVKPVLSGYKRLVDEGGGE